MHLWFKWESILLIESNSLEMNVPLKKEEEMLRIALATALRILLRNLCYVLYNFKMYFETVWQASPYNAFLQIGYLTVNIRKEAVWKLLS